MHSGSEGDFVTLYFIGSCHDSVALNRNLFETVIREVLLEGSEHRVEIYEGSGTSWRLTK